MVHVLVAVEGDEAACEKFGDRLASRQAGDDVTVSVLKNENSLQRSALRKGEMRFAMPGRAVHVDLGGVTERLPS